MTDDYWTKLSSDTQSVLVLLALAQDPLLAFEVRNLRNELFEAGIVETTVGLEALKKEFSSWATQGIVVKTFELETNSPLWALEPGLRLEVLLRLRQSKPDQLAVIASVLFAEAPGRYSDDLELRLHRWLLAAVSEKPGLLREAEAHLVHALVGVTDRADFEFTDGLGAVAELGIRYALARQQWTNLSLEARLGLVHVMNYHTVMTGSPHQELARLVQQAGGGRELQLAVQEWLACSALVAADWATVDTVAEPSTTSATLQGARVLAAALRGRQAQALEILDDLLSQLSALRGSKKEGFVPGPLFVWLACYALIHQRASFSKVKSWAAQWCRALQPSAHVLWAIFRHQGKARAFALVDEDLTKSRLPSVLDRALVNMGLIWNGLTPGFRGDALVLAHSFFEQQGARWYQLEVSATAEKLCRPAGDWPERVRSEKARLAMDAPFVDLIRAEAAWESGLNRLADLKFDRPPVAAPEVTEVLAWVLDTERVTVEPVLRKPLKGGGWSAPRNAPRARLGKGDHPAILPQDRAPLRALKMGYYGWELDDKRAIEALAGHPFLFLSTSLDQPMVLETCEVELRVEEGPDGLKFGLSSALDSDKATLIKLASLHWQVLVVTEKLKKVAEVVGRGLLVPLEARARVVEVLGSLAAGIQVRSPLLQENDHATAVTADPRPVVLLTPRNLGLHLEVHVRPLGVATPLLRPGEGPVLVHAKVGPRLLTSTRDLPGERNALAQALTSCPQWDTAMGNSRTLEVEDPAEALALIAELRDAGEALTVEWPQGGKIAVHRRVGVGSVKLQLSKEKQWFHLGGSVTLDEGKVIEFRQLLSTGTPSRFVRLVDGDWVELEAQLLKQLEHLAVVTETTGTQLRLAPLALAGSDLLLDHASTSATDDIDRWRRLWKAGISPHLGLPSSLSAELRPYQLEGFRWLARLSEVGAGACLADDMGLGKTVQTIALLAHRASLGPSLVIAPTSVAPNWLSEIRRFDRSLEPVLLSEGERGDRQSLVDSLVPGQVLVATYGLLVADEPLFTRRLWNVVVLDESQAVKNHQAKRTKAVMGLKAEFRLAVTGTPLQNHLGELWTLFEFLNPGLLGTKKSYTDRFWNPIESRQDQGARRALQALIRPFLLRRTKNQVLADLPEKIETSLAVDLGPGEREFYEALRRRAVEQMAGLTDKKAGEAQILVLAHLMKLRRACCHPALAGGPDSPSSSKLDVLESLLEGLIDNGHRTLVFSQFTDHLALIRARLEARGWACDYLDGSTPASQRGALVERFQSGTAPVFLISLQAGGTGLNLTAADYVVHMDPWWNPAVEDQASDRAHRLGQTKPVTIYRLVARDTIEERIVWLHRAKRDLAEALLEGTEAVARLDTQQLLELISGESS